MITIIGELPSEGGSVYIFLSNGAEILQLYITAEFEWVFVQIKHIYKKAYAVDTTT